MTAIRLIAIATSIILGLLVDETGLAADYRIAWYNTDGGGETRGIGGAYELDGAIGQPDASPVVIAGGDYALTGGFWFETPPGDCNADGLLDLLDHADFVPCLDGPIGITTDTACRCFDLDWDADVDLLDFAALTRWFAS